MRVLLYGRVSTQRQAEHDLSIPDQLRQLREYCQRNGHEIVQEFRDAGLSATDDNRPGFREMIDFAIDRSNGVEAVLVLTTSRFFRDAVGSRVYKKTLKRAGVRVVSITQETSDDPMGGFIEGIFELQDQYESEINGFHTLRGMKENARRGGFNGSTPPFGYAVEATVDENGVTRRRLVVNPTEAEMVRLMFDLYVNGLEGERLGIKNLTDPLNRSGYRTRSGGRWSKVKIGQRLADRTYIGEHHYNQVDGKTKRPKPQSEWVLIPVPPVVDLELFERAAKLRQQGRPSVKRPPSVTSSPALLTGLLYCGRCGSRMTRETAKGGAYHYYNCSSFIRKGKSSCAGNRVSQPDLERQVLEHLSTKLFALPRIRQMVRQLSREISRLRKANSGKLADLEASLQDVRLRIKRHHEALECGAVDMTLVGDRLRELRAQEQELVEEMERACGPRPLPPYLLKEESLLSIQRNLQQVFLLNGNGVAKRYLAFLLERIEVNGDEVRLEANPAALLAGGLQAGRFAGVDQLSPVLTVDYDWLG